MLFAERKTRSCGWSAVRGARGSIGTQTVITRSFWARRHLGEEFPLFSPLSKRQHFRCYQASPALPAQHVRLEAKQGSDRSARPQASAPQVGCSPEVLAEGSGNPSAAEEIRLGRRRCQKYRSRRVTAHPLTPFYQTVSGKRKTSSLKRKTPPVQLGEKYFHLLILNFHVKQNPDFETKCGR